MFDEVLYNQNGIRFGIAHTKSGLRAILDYPLAAAVIPLSFEEGEPVVTMVRQTRLAHSESDGIQILEIPAGKTDPGESGLQAAIRELREETGLRSLKMELLCRFYPAVGISTEEIEIYLALDCEPGEPDPEADEDIEIIPVKFSEWDDLIAHREICDGKTILAGFLLRDYLNRPKL